MLYIINQRNHVDLQYRDGQNHIVHLEADLHDSVKWAQFNSHHWAFTLSNAGARFFEDRNDLSQLDEINWGAVQTDRWSGDGIPSSISEGKQAEFLIEDRFPWSLVERIGVYSQHVYQQVMSMLPDVGKKPKVEVIPAWYY